MVFTRQRRIVEQLLQPTGAVVLERRQQVALQAGKIGYALGGQPVQADGGLREEARQKRWNFFFTPAGCSFQVICSVSRA